MRRRLIYPLCVSLWVVVLAGCSTTVRPQVELPKNIPAARVFHDDFDRFLARYVGDEGLVDYRAAKQNHDDLDRYVALLARVSPDSDPNVFIGRTARLTYWINAYNASVLNLVLDAYPIESVKDIRAPVAFLFPDVAGFFFFRKVVLGGKSMNLYKLENKIIRKRFEDPRIHFAINCASISCPQLPNHAFRADDLETQLDDDTRRFVAEARNVRIELEDDDDEEDGKRVVLLSAIFDWYEGDFTKWMKRNRPDQPATLDAYVAEYLPEAEAQDMRDCADCALDFFSYDWNLNDQHPQ